MVKRGPLPLYTPSTLENLHPIVDPSVYSVSFLTCYLRISCIESKMQFGISCGLKFTSLRSCTYSPTRTQTQLVPSLLSSTLTLDYIVAKNGGRIPHCSAHAQKLDTLNTSTHILTMTCCLAGTSPSCRRS